MAPKVPVTKPSNPKDGIGAIKLPLSLIPPTALALVSLAHYDGKSKYGAWNWRNHGVLASVYLDAAERHLRAWQEGQTAAEDSGVHHLAHAICCLNIILDAEINGKLIDDRPPSGNYEALVSLITPLVAQLQAKHKERKPRNFNIADTEECKQS